jgi:hypothetical protein
MRQFGTTDGDYHHIRRQKAGPFVALRMPTRIRAVELLVDLRRERPALGTRVARANEKSLRPYRRSCRSSRRRLLRGCGLQFV